MVRGLGFLIRFRGGVALALVCAGILVIVEAVSQGGVKYAQERGADNGNVQDLDAVLVVDMAKWQDCMRTVMAETDPYKRSKMLVRCEREYQAFDRRREQLWQIEQLRDLSGGAKVAEPPNSSQPGTRATSN